MKCECGKPEICFLPKWSPDTDVECLAFWAKHPSRKLIKPLSREAAMRSVGKS